MTTTERATKIAALNDALRRDPLSGRHGHVMITSGVAAYGSAFTTKVLYALSALTPEDFEPGNDPYGERDFAVFEVDGVKLYGKVDTFEKDSNYLAGAETPDNPETTERVLTILLPEEY